MFIRLSAIILFIGILLATINLSLIATDTEDEGDDVKVYDKDGVLLSCGVERWAVKTCIDHDTILVNFNNIVSSTIAYQRSLPTPPSLPPSNRLPLEDTVYSITGRLTQYKLEDDGDIHCVITDANNLTIVTEICDPTCPGIAGTSRGPMLTALRSWFYANFPVSTSWHYPNVNITLTGVGFYDFQHGQIGIPPNGREIHPILTMSLLTPVQPGSNGIPSAYKLYQNYPNPFNPSTKIDFDISKTGNVNLKVYDMLGREAAVLINNELRLAGSYSVDFNASKLSSGIYFYRLEAEGFAESRKMILVK